MIQSLQIRNLAVVENVCIEFSAGLNVITGETGAGKSILIGALGLILGDRADKSMIRTGEDFCSVEAAFRIHNMVDLNIILNEYGIPECEEDLLIIRRVIGSAGKILVNDTNITLQALKRIGNLLVDIHGPHEHQSLINRDFQLTALDDYGALGEDRMSYMESYRVSKQLAEKKNLLLSDSDEDVARRIDTLKFQIKEIESAELKLGEEETIQREHEMLGQAQHIIGLIHVALNDLTENESSAFSCMVTVQKALNELYPLVDKASEWQNEARAIAIQIQELSSEASRLVQDINQDPARLQWLDERLNLYRKTKRKYGNNIEDVFQHLERSRKTLKELYAREEHINKIDSELQATQSLMHKKGKKLSMLRKENAASLSEAVAFELRALGFGHGSFDIAVSDTTPGTSGMNEIDFQFAPNKGESMRPMRLIASSGEISRVMLAIKSILAAHDKVPTLIFDEIDMNIGGTTARAVGFKLAGLATQRQILCITHLPQVAVHGTTHFSVAKKQKNGRTITEINLIKKNKRVEEIARMLGGRDSTAVAWRHAKELLDKAKLT